MQHEHIKGLPTLVEGWEDCPECRTAMTAFLLNAARTATNTWTVAHANHLRGTVEGWLVDPPVSPRGPVRLEWEPHNDGHKLAIHVGKLSFGILWVGQQEDGWEVVIRLTHYTWLSAEKAAALVADHIATLDLPCPLPPFPGLVQP